MKISKQKLQKIINEELEMAQNDAEMGYSGPNLGSKIDDSEGKMAKNQLIHIAKYAIAMAKGLEENEELEGWVQAKITLAEDYISKVKHYLETELQVEFDEPSVNELLKQEPPEPEEKKNYAGEGKFYYDI